MHELGDRAPGQHPATLDRDHAERHDVIGGVVEAGRLEVE
jgi:hypothetical protein